MELEFTGERLVPDKIPITEPIYVEHITRYMFAEPYVKNIIVLDAGCGCGYGTNLLSNTAEKVIGIDISPEAIKYCNLYYKRKNNDFLIMNCKELQFPCAYFDVVVSYEMIEHINEQVDFIKEVARVLKKDGVLIISTPNKVKYNEKSTERNPYHLSELDLNEFKNILGKFFGRIMIYGQRIDPKFFVLKNMLEKTASLERRVLQVEKRTGYFLIKSLLPKKIKDLAKSFFKNSSDFKTAKQEKMNSTFPLSMRDVEISLNLEEATYFISVCQEKI